MTFDKEPDAVEEHERSDGIGSFSVVNVVECGNVGRSFGSIRRRSESHFDLLGFVDELVKLIGRGKYPNFVRETVDYSLELVDFLR